MLEKPTLADLPRANPSKGGDAKLPVCRTAKSYDSGAAKSNVGPAAPAGSTSTPLPIHAAATAESRPAGCRGCRMHKKRISRPRTSRGARRCPAGDAERLLATTRTSPPARALLPAEAPPPPPPARPAPHRRRLPQPGAATLEWTVPTTQTNGCDTRRSRGLPHPLWQERAAARPDDRDQESEHLDATWSRAWRQARTTSRSRHSIRATTRASARTPGRKSSRRSSFSLTAAVGPEPGLQGDEDAP